MNEQLIPAFASGETLRQQISNFKRDGNEEAFDIWWLGQSGFLIQWNRHCLLLDPYLSDSLTRKYANTDKPHVRMSELVIDPGMLDQIDIVSSSHNHTDHLDADTLLPLLEKNPNIRFVIPEANRDFVCDRLKCPSSFPIGLNEGERVTIHPFTFHGIPAAHNDIERDAEGRCKYMGYVVRFGNFAVYHSGDTLVYEDLASILRPFRVDLALLPINGNDPSRRVAGNMNAEEAATIGKAIGAQFVIPHHYHMFEFNTADPETFAAAARQFDQPFRILSPGEHFRYSLNR